MRRHAFGAYRYVDNLLRIPPKAVAWRMYNRALVPRWHAVARRLRPRRRATGRQWRGLGTSGPTRLAEEWLAKRWGTVPFADRRDLAAVARTAQACDPEAVAASIAMADAAVGGQFTLLEAKPSVAVARPVDWQADPLNDIEWPHALNRFRRYARALSRAHLYTGREDYAETLLALMEDWIEQNPLGTPIAWASMATSLRLIEWCWALHLLRGSKALTAARLAPILGSMMLQVRHLARHPEFELSDNHLIYNLGSLRVVARMLPRLVPRAVARWARGGYVRQLRRQHRADGMNAEQSTHYFVQVARLYAETWWLGRLAGAEDPVVGGYIQRFVDDVVGMMRPDGTLPLLSDAFTSFFEDSATSDAHVLLGWAAVALGRGDCKHLTGDLREGAVWLLGRRAEGFRAVQAAAPAAKTYFLDDSGYFFFRDGWLAEATYGCVDAGPLGFDPVPAHGHPDALSFEWYLHGRPVVVDPGTYEYEPGEWAYYFRRTRAHAAVTIDKRDQATPWGFARWVDLPKVRVLSRGEAGGVVWVDAEHNGYAWLENPVFHRRRIAFVMPDLVVVEDLLTGKGEHLIQQTFPLHPSWACKIGQGAAAMLRREGAPAVVIAPLRFPGVVRSLAPKGQAHPQLWGFCASNYGVCEPAHVVVFAARGAMPARLLTVLCLGNEAPRAVAPNRWELPGGEAVRSIAAGSEGGFAVMEARGGSLRRVVAAGLASAAWEGKTVFSGMGCGAWLVAARSHDAWTVRCDGEGLWKWS
jgi:uncharacterized heparinase superfamily protein